MLNLTFTSIPAYGPPTMNILFTLITVLNLVFVPSLPSYQGLNLNIEFPQSGQILTGVVSIRGTNAIDGFSYSELSFSYAGRHPDTWFPFHRSDQPIISGVLGDWDTTLITDGNYSLRLCVFLQDGSSLETIIRGLQVRNYSPANTVTATVTSTPTLSPTITTTPTLSHTITSTPYPTATPFPSATYLVAPSQIPDNPAALPTKRAGQSFLIGSLISGVIFLMIFLFMYFRSE